MDSTNIALSDAERNKELFEYEMTQVIMQLKGEFAKISGKDMGINAEQLAAPQVDIPGRLPDVTVAFARIDTPAEVPEMHGVQALSTVQLQTTEVNCPTVPAASMANIPQVQLDGMQLDCPAVSKLSIKETLDVQIADTELDYPSISEIHSSALPQVEIALPQVVDAPKIALSAELPAVELYLENPVVVPADVSVPSELQDARIEPIQIGVPETALKLPEISDVETESVQCEYPQIAAVKQYAPASIQVEAALKISIPAAPTVEFDIHSVQAAGSSLPEPVTVPQPKPYTPLEVQSETGGVTEIPAAQVKAYQPCTVQMTQSAVDVSVPSVSVPVMKAVNLTVLPNVAEAVPDILNHLPANMAVQIQMPAISADVPHIAPIALPTVLAASTDAISIPDPPDVSTEIQSILESVTEIGK